MVEATVITTLIDLGPCNGPAIFAIARPETWSCDDNSPSAPAIGDPIICHGYWSDAAWATLMADRDHGPDCVLAQRTGATRAEMLDTLDRCRRKQTTWGREGRGMGAAQPDLATADLNKVRQLLAKRGLIVPDPLNGKRGELIDAIAVAIRGRAR